MIKSCLFCTFHIDFPQSQPYDLQLEDVVSFKRHLTSLPKSCSRCVGKDLICLIGRSGSGKSTIFNLLLQREYLLVKNPVGGVCLQFQGRDISKVSSSLNSVTAFPVIKVFDQNSLLVDFPGFLDTRSGGLQLLQHILLLEILECRKIRIIVVKDIRVERDPQFVELLNQPWITPMNTLVVITKVERHFTFNLTTYCEGKLSKNIPIELMKVATQNTSFSNFQKRLSKQISNLKPSVVPIRLEISAEVFKFQEKALKMLHQKIDLELRKVFEKELPNLIVQPYDICYIRELLNGRYSLVQVLDLFHDTTLFPSHIEIANTPLPNLRYQFETLQSLSSTTTIQSLNHWSPSSSDLFINLHNRVNTFSQPPLKPLSGDLLDGLNQWHELAKLHYIQHVSFRCRALVLAHSASRNEFAFAELVRLADYRHQIFERLFEVWRKLETVLISELDKEDSDSALKALRFKDAKYAVIEILRFSKENQRELAVTFELITRKFIGVALADGAIATGAWGVRTGLGTQLPPLSTTTAVILGVTTAAALASFLRHLYLTNRQIEKIRAIGFDFSFLKVEVQLWSEIRIAAERRDVQAILSCLEQHERQFRLLIDSTNKGVIKAKKKLKEARSKGIDVGGWEGLITKVGKMCNNIFAEMKAREHSAPGCYFAEHEWEERSILSFKFSGIKSCCSVFALKADFECKHCHFLCHSGICQLNALQIPCKSLIIGQGVVSNPNQTSTAPEIKTLVAIESKKWNEKQEFIQTAALCELVYNDDISYEEDIIVATDSEIKYLISFSGSTAFVVIRGTEILSLSNWMTNVNAIMVELAPDSNLFVHSGYFRASQRIYQAILKTIKDFGGISRVVFTGHSLGGAIASLLHLKILWDKKPVKSQSIGFGSPMLYDKSVEQWLRAKNYNKLFKTFCNQFDIVPGIMLGITEGLQDNLRGNTDISSLAAATVGIMSREITKNYHPVGIYIFLEIGRFWETSDAELIVFRLQQCKTTGKNVDFHQMASYREQLRIYINGERELVTHEADEKSIK